MISLYGWVRAAYLLASTVTTVPLYGKLADRRGRKPVLLAGLGMFVIGSVASGLASTIHELIAFRALQGLGAGPCSPSCSRSSAICTRPRSRPRAGLLPVVCGARPVSKRPAARGRDRLVAVLAVDLPG
ncbi:MAG: MFS transporter [Polyangiaceae bacterium]|nr:MFS transporter [Polyangiaceae bacterium]